MRNFRRKKGKTGAVNSKKIKIDGITFASSLEAYTYKQLKDAKVAFQYEGEVFELMQPFRHYGTYLKSTKGKSILSDQKGKVVRNITYTPDFVSHEHKFIIETKGFVPSNHSFPLRWKMFLKHLQDNNMGDYSVFLPKNRKQVDEVINVIKNESR